MASICITHAVRVGGVSSFAVFELPTSTDTCVNRAHLSRLALTWLCCCCCCCWSFSWRMAWARPTGGFSVESVRAMSTTAGQEEPAAPLRSLQRPLLARTHMGNTDILDCSTSCRRTCVTWVKRTKAPDWLGPFWVAATIPNHSSERPRGEGGGRFVERKVQSEARMSLTFDCNAKLPWWIMAKCPKQSIIWPVFLWKYNY